jgi:ribosomal protein S18 acetylase RimI-like enzyme
MRELPVVRSLEVGESERVLRALPGTVADLASWQAAAASEPICALVAESGGEPVGVALGAIGRRIFTVVELRAAEVAVDAAAGALVRYLRAQLPGFALEARTHAGAAGDALASAFAHVGLALIRDEVTYGRTLPADGTGLSTPFVFSGYEETGKAAMVDALAEVSRDDPYFTRRGMDALAALDEMIENNSTDGRLDSSLWYLAELDRRLAGVVLGQCKPDTHEGSFAYIGLTPEFRGTGLGRHLHRAGLDLLAAAGATEYRDATALDNHAMQRVFEHNGCARLGSARVWRLDTEPVPTRFDSLAHLRAWLEADGHSVETLDVDRWLRLAWRSGYNLRPVEIGWIADARVTQVMHTFGFTVPRQAAAPLARLICTMNAELNVPGFVLDDSAMSVGFRNAVLQDGDGATASRQLLTACDLVVNTAEAYENDLARLCAVNARPTLLERTQFDRGAMTRLSSARPPTSSA